MTAKLNAQAIILDTETHTLNGLPIEIAYAPVALHQGKLILDQGQIFDQYYQVNEKISYGAMAVHHILESDLVNQPHYSTFRLPEETQYIIGHNIDYDIQAIARCGVDTSQLKAICTLALARHVWPDFDSHNISALIYRLSNGSEQARQMLKNAHRADADILLTANIVMHLLHAIQQHTPIHSMQDLFEFSQQARIPSVMPFGKHKGTPLKDLPTDYVQWLVENKQDLDPHLKQALQPYLTNAV
ncbi:MAG: DUF3820 family protein [Acinetobacter sp.]|nr:DUF3820 family protein [Acinetobacter sp.]